MSVSRKTLHDGDCWWWDQKICTCGYAHQNYDGNDFQVSNARIEHLRDLESKLPLNALGKPVAPGSKRWFLDKASGIVYSDKARMPDCSRSYPTKKAAVDSAKAPPPEKN